MNTGFPRILLTAVLGALIANCAGVSAQRTGEVSGYGPNPTLPRPRPTLIPTVNIAEAKGWQKGGMPTPAKGLKVNAFATGLDHPRWLTVLPNGDVLVAEANKPAKKSRGIKAWLTSMVMKRAGAGVPSADRITPPTVMARCCM